MQRCASVFISLPGKLKLMTHFVVQEFFVGWRVRDNRPPEKFSQPANQRATLLSMSDLKDSTLRFG
jgi:hypothetical protein